MFDAPAGAPAETRRPGGTSRQAALVQGWRAKWAPPSGLTFRPCRSSARARRTPPLLPGPGALKAEVRLGGRQGKDGWAQRVRTRALPGVARDAPNRTCTVPDRRANEATAP